MDTSKPTVLDLFAGVGGFSWGFHQSFEVIGAIEREPAHAGTYKVNFPSTQMICASVCQVTGSWIRNNIGSPTIVIGGPPCQSFSLQGRRNKNDLRTQLLHEFARLVLELLPPYFIMENVKGLVLGDMWEIFEQLCDRLSLYTLSHQVLNAADYGVPQDRERVFLFGALPGYPLPNFPKPQTQKVTVAEAILDLPDVDEFEELFEVDHLPYSCMKESASAYAQSLRRELDFITGVGRTRHSNEVISRFMATPIGHKEPVSRFVKLNPNSIAPTLMAGGSDMTRTAVRPIDPYRNAVITVRQAARLSSFPDDFRFHQAKCIGHKQVGNAVPPLISQAIATEFASIIN